MSSIAFVGAGPTALYALAAFIANDAPRARITLFEAQDRAGCGTPYSPDWNDPAMLANIASVEIPPLAVDLLTWLRAQPRPRLTDWGIDLSRLNERTFVPRVVLGAYFTSQLDALVTKARVAGHTVDVCTGRRVTDVAIKGGRPRIAVDLGRGDVTTEVFDYVVLATGHQWPIRQQPSPGVFTTPWPAQTLADIPPGEIGILGSSLTALDAVVAIARRHGAFVTIDGQLQYRADPRSDALRITMLSRKGLLPEADFFFVLPYAPLGVCTPTALSTLLEREPDHELLDRVYDLFRAELAEVDPDYHARLRLHEVSLDDFPRAYFADRLARDPFEWAERNLAEARHNHRHGVVVAWRDAILRMHEVIGPMAGRLSSAAHARFERTFRPVFVDNYGAVPHTSIERLLALHRNGRLQVRALGETYEVEPTPGAGGAIVRGSGGVHAFSAFVDATGQKPLPAILFPFLSLIEQGVINDDVVAGTGEFRRGVAVDDRFRIVSRNRPQDRLFCLSLPFLLSRWPFAQGLTSSYEMGCVVGRELALACHREEKEAA